MENTPNINLPEKVPTNGKVHKGMQNLRPPWQKGGCANPTGKTGPKLKTIFCKTLAEIDPDDPQGRTRLDTLLDQLVALAKKGHPTAINAIVDRLDPILRNNITINNHVPAPVIESLRRIGIEHQEGASA